MNRTTLQGWLAFPLCAIQSLVVAFSMASDDPIEMSNPILLVVVALAFGFGMLALAASIRGDLFDDIVGDGWFVSAGLVVMLGLDIWCAIRVVNLFAHVGPFLICGTAAMALLLGGRMGVTLWNFVARLPNGGRFLAPLRVSQSVR